MKLTKIAVIAVFTVYSGAVFAEPCKDCDPVTGLTATQVIQAQRAADAKRVSAETSKRPWDGLNLSKPEMPVRPKQ